MVQGAGISLNDFAAAVTRFLELDSGMIRIFAPLAFNPSTLCNESDPTGEFNLRHWTFRRTQALDFVERPEFFHIPAKLKAAVRSFLQRSRTSSLKERTILSGLSDFAVLKVGGAPPIERLIIDVAIVIALYTAARLALRFYFPPDTCILWEAAGKSRLGTGYASQKRRQRIHGLSLTPRRGIAEPEGGSSTKQTASGCHRCEFGFFIAQKES